MAITMEHITEYYVANNREEAYTILNYLFSLGCTWFSLDKHYRIKTDDDRNFITTYYVKNKGSNLFGFQDEIPSEDSHDNYYECTFIDCTANAFYGKIKPLGKHNET